MNATSQPDVRAHYMNLVPAVTIPLAQSVIGGLSLGISAWVVSWAVSRSVLSAASATAGAELVVVFASAGVANAPAIGVAVAAVTQSLQWFAAVRDWRERLWSLEQATGLDLDMDGQIGSGDEPQAHVPAAVMRIEISENGGRKMSFIDLPTSPHKMRQLADGLLEGQPFSEKIWTGNGRPFSAAEFSSLRAEMIKRGWAYWRNPEAHAQGVELTSVGKFILRRIIENAPALPYQEGAQIYEQRVRVRACARKGRNL